MNQDEAIVITEDDILKPPSAAKRRTRRPAARPLRPEAAPGTVGWCDATADARFASSETAAGKTSERRAHPAIASTLSLWIWGSGQFYCGDRKLAVLFLLCEIQVLAFHYMLYQIWDRLRGFARLFFISEWELVLYASAVDLCVIFLMLFIVAQAYRAAERQSGRFEGLHRPLLAGLTSVIMPGWGQMLNGQLGKGIFFLFAFLLQAYVVVLYLMTPLYRVVLTLDPQQELLQRVIAVGMGLLSATAVMWLLSAYDAFLVARYTRRLRS